MIDKLLLNKRFFRNKTGRIILPEHLDDQFNTVTNYINNDLIPYIESINFDATNGEAGYPFAVFCNIDNNDVGYQYLNDINFDDNLLPLNKLIPIVAGSVLGSDTAGNIITITPTDNDQLIFLGAPDPTQPFYLPSNIIFRKIISDDIANNSLTGQQIGVVNNDNFAPNTFINLIPDNSILSNNLQNVTNDNIALNAVGFQHIGLFPNLPYNVNIAGQILLDDFDDNSITADKIQDGTIAWANFTIPKPINANNLANGFITDAHFKAYNVAVQPPLLPNAANLIASNFNTIVNFPLTGVQVYNNMQLTADKITLNCLSATNFTQDIQDAIAKYQQIKNQIIIPPIQVLKTKPDNIVPLVVSYASEKKFYSKYGVPLSIVVVVDGKGVANAGFTGVYDIKYWYYVSDTKGTFYLLDPTSGPTVINLPVKNGDTFTIDYLNFFNLDSARYFVSQYRIAIPVYSGATKSVPSFYKFSASGYDI